MFPVFALALISVEGSIDAPKNATNRRWRPDAPPAETGASIPADVELRRVANEAPEIAQRLRQIIEKVEADADGLERELG